MQEPGLDQRHRDQDGEISHKRKDTHLGTLRDEYGENLFSEYRKDTHLETLLKDYEVDSLSELLKKANK